MKVIYIAGPYRNSAGEYFVRQNIRRAEEEAIFVWKSGAVAICPHKNTAGFGGAAPDHVWLEGDLELLKRCDAVYAIDGWSASSGATAEVAFAKQNNIPIFFSKSEVKAWLT